MLVVHEKLYLGLKLLSYTIAHHRRQLSVIIKENQISDLDRGHSAKMGFEIWTQGRLAIATDRTFSSIFFSTEYSTVEGQKCCKISVACNGRAELEKINLIKSLADR